MKTLRQLVFLVTQVHCYIYKTQNVYPNVYQTVLLIYNWVRVCPVRVRVIYAIMIRQSALLAYQLHQLPFTINLDASMQVHVR